MKFEPIKLTPEQQAMADEFDRARMQILNQMIADLYAIPKCAHCSNPAFVFPDGRIGKLCAECAWKAIESLMEGIDDTDG